MSSRITEIVIDCSDANRVAGFWSAVLGWAVQGMKRKAYGCQRLGLTTMGVSR